MLSRWPNSHISFYISCSLLELFLVAPPSHVVADRCGRKKKSRASSAAEKKCPGSRREAGESVWSLLYGMKSPECNSLQPPKLLPEKRTKKKLKCERHYQTIFRLLLQTWRRKPEKLNLILAPERGTRTAATSQRFGLFQNSSSRPVKDLILARVDRCSEDSVTQWMDAAGEKEKEVLMEAACIQVLQ